MRTTVDLPDDLYRQLKARAALGGLKVRELITTYLERGLQTLPENTPSRPRSDPPIAIAPTGAPIPARSRSELQELERRDETARRPRSTRR
ncbi:MAG TPA: hypothetical protein VFK13_04425 [Gemmatimonadaceae bacterium]|nr:hypothetical protein [Gemmatimonadaceae bacterium]